MRYAHRPPEGGAQAPLQLKVFRLSYWPTAAVSIGSEFGKFVVAGKAQSGATRVELFVLEPPAIGVATLPGTGQVVATVTEPRISQVSKVFEQNAVGLDMIQTASPNLADPGNRVFLQFWDSKKVQELNIASGTLTAIASPVSGAAPLHAPSLQADLDLVQRFNHVDHGYVYAFQKADLGSLGTMFLDSNRDGTLDTVHPLTLQVWESMGLGDNSKHL